jgi:uncharacterized protein
MFVVCECLDNPQATEARAETIQAHREYLKSNTETLRIAGPLFNEAGDAIGSMLIVRTEDLQGARDFVDGDPFAVAGVFAEVRYKPFKPTINNLA